MLKPRPPVHGTATLILKIETRRQNGRLVGSYYRVERLPASQKVASPAFRLHKPDGTFHDVRCERDGWVCDCQDFVWNRQNRELGCKHCEATKAILKTLGANQ